MKQQLKPNRNITQGDQGMAELKKIQEIKDQMENWSDDFIKKVYYEPKTPLWFQAAKETLNERRVPRDGPKQTPPKPKKKKKWDRGTKEERAARSTAWKLDRQLDQRIHNDL